MNKKKNLKKIRLLRQQGNKAFRSWFLKRPKLSKFLLGILTHMKKSSIYLAGGIVRDIITHKPNRTHDIDMMIVNCDFKELGEVLYKLKKQKIFGIKDVVQAGKLFPVYKASVLWNTEAIDIALARTEVSTGTGHKDFQIETKTVSAKEDSSRRDFTLNAIFFKIRKKRGTISGNIVDYQNGISDLVGKEIKAVGNPRKRFLEDPLRMLRAIRQKNQLSFHIEKNTWESIKILMPKLINTISGERISVELLKSLEANPSTMEDLKESGILDLLIPEFYLCKEEIFTKTLNNLKRLNKEKPSKILLAACLLSEIANYEIEERKKEYKDKKFKGKFSSEDPDFYTPQIPLKIIKRLYLPQQKQISYLLYCFLIFKNIKYISYPLSVCEELFKNNSMTEDIKKFLRITDVNGENITQIDALLEKFYENPPLINGIDLIEIGIPRLDIQKILRNLRQLQLTLDIRDKSILLSKADNSIDKGNI